MKIDTDEGNLTVCNAIFTQENTVICETLSQPFLLNLTASLVSYTYHTHLLKLLMQLYFPVILQITVRVLYCFLYL